MRIEINPRSLLNLKKNICEVLYKLHPLVLDDLVGMSRSLGKILGTIDLNNMSLEEREFLADIRKKVDFSKKPENNRFKEEMDKSNNPNAYDKDEKNNLLNTIQELKKDKNACSFHNLRKYIQLDTDEYIPIKISVEVEDYILGKKVRELVEALEQTRAPEQFYLNKKEMDEDAYFAEGYGLTMNEEQLKQRDDFLSCEDVEGLERFLRSEKLYP